MKGTGWVITILCFGCAAAAAQTEKPWERRRREMQDRLGGVPAEILAQQRLDRPAIPELDDAVRNAVARADEEARSLLADEHHHGRVLLVPGEFPTIQAGIDRASAGDTVRVGPGTYYELLVMKDGVRLVSDSARDGDGPVTVPGARLRLPRRTLRTIIDGSKSTPSRHGLIDFGPGVGRQTIVDGFTLQGLPEQDHHVPGHAHGLNIRGASPVIMKCLIRNNGSTGIGNHVVYKDQGEPIDTRDFRAANIRHRAEPVIYRNVIHGSLGLGIGCNHFSGPLIFGNEVFANNDAALGESPSPGIGAKHGAIPVIVGNIVHDNPGGGILSRIGEKQGAHPVDRGTCPRVEFNVVFANGTLRPAIANRGGGTPDSPVVFRGNVVFDAGAVGIGLSDGAVGVIEENHVVGSQEAGIAVDGATALRLHRNSVTKAQGPGFVIVDGAKVEAMVQNAAHGNKGPRFMLRDGTIRKNDERKDPSDPIGDTRLRP